MAHPATSLSELVRVMGRRVSAKVKGAWRHRTTTVPPRMNPTHGEVDAGMKEARRLNRESTAPNVPQDSLVKRRLSPS